MDKINFVEIGKQNESVRKEIITEIDSLLASGGFVGGKYLNDFESKLANYNQMDYAIGCSDGTAALKLIFLSLNITKKDKVIVPANTYIASSNAVIHAGGTPAFVDCNDKTFLLDLNQVEDKLKKGVKYVLVVHLYGNPCPMDELLNLSMRYGAVIIEDNAQAFGANFKCKKTGTFGIASAVSFYPAKNLGSCGQGGAVVTNNVKIKDAVKLYSEQGAESGANRYYHKVIGYNDRLHSIQALYLSKMLEKLDGFNIGRNIVADFYKKKLCKEKIQTVTGESFHSYHLFEYKCESFISRERIAQKLIDYNIPYGYHYPIPIHKQEAYKEFNDLSFPISELLAKTLISLPIHPYLTEEQVEMIANIINEYDY